MGIIYNQRKFMDRKQYRKILLVMLLGSLFVQTKFCICSPTASDKPIVLNKTKQLFLDDYLIASKENVVRKIHPATKHPGNPIIRPTEPWEKNAVLIFGSVIREGEKFRMWYLAGGGMAYAESSDGLRWTKPVLDFIEVDGLKTNLWIKLRTNAEKDEKALAEYKAGAANAIPFFRAIHNIFKDPEDPDPSRRYKMTYTCIDYRGKSKYRGMGIAVSRDGIKWKFIKNWVSESVNDKSYSMYDAAKKKYVVYGRTLYHSPEVLKAWGHDEYFKKSNWGRAITRLESSDFVNWDYTEWQKSPIVLAADTNDPMGTEIYSMLVFPYESVYVALPQMFYNQDSNQLLDVQLAVSRDGVKFERVGDRTPFIGCADVGEWDRFNTAWAANPPIEMGDELWFYYSGRTYRHGPYKGPDNTKSSSKLTRGAIGLATIKRDRFVSLGASFDKGVVITKLVKLAGKSLHLNAKADFGEILVEVLDKDKKVIAKSKLLSKDSLDIGVEWDSGDLNAVNGPVTLRITLRNALLFALWCS